MTVKLNRWQATLLVALLVFFWWMGTISFAPATTDLRLESRINRLESELNRLNSQVNRIASQVAMPARPTPSPRIDIPDIATAPSLEEQFDNLATLAVETKLQLRALEARVEQLEAYHQP